MREDRRLEHRPLFRYLDDAASLPAGVATLSQREAVRRAYNALTVGEQEALHRAVLERVGDPSRSLADRTRLVELLPILELGVADRTLAHRQLVDDVRSLLRYSDDPPASVQRDARARLRCLLEMEFIESVRFWQDAYLLSGNPCGLLVFTAIAALDPGAAVAWIDTYPSKQERRRILERIGSEITARHPAAREPIRQLLETQEPESVDRKEPGRTWSSLLSEILDGAVHVEAEDGSTLRYLRGDAAKARVYPLIDRLEADMLRALESRFAEWPSRVGSTDLPTALRLLSLSREYQSTANLWSLGIGLRALILEVTQTAPEADRKRSVAVGNAALDSLRWFDRLIDGIFAAADLDSAVDSEGASQELARLLDTVEAMARIPEWEVAACRELVRHSPHPERKAAALTAMLRVAGPSMAEVEELDWRLGTDVFQGVVCRVLVQSELRAKLGARRSDLAAWCERTYQARDRLAPGSGWTHSSGLTPALYKLVAESRDDQDPSRLLERALESTGVSA